MPKRKIANKKNLILGKDGQEQEDVDNSSTSSDIQDHTDVSTDSALSGSSNGVTPIISYWWPNMTLALVADETPFPFSSPPLLHKYIIQSKTNPQLIYPFLYYNDFWMLQEQLNPINETVK